MDFDEYDRLTLVDVPKHFPNKAPKEVVRDYDRAIDEAPKNPLNYNNRAIAYFQMGCYHEAIVDFTEAIKRGLADLYIYRDRGFVREELGDMKAQEGTIHVAIRDYERAIEDYRKTIEADPTFESTAIPIIERARNKIDALKQREALRKQAKEKRRG